MANVSVTSHYDKWRPGGGWKDPCVLYSPIPIEDITIRVRTNSTDIGIMDIVDFVQAIGDATDLYDATLSADNSTTPAAYVPDTEWNLKQLAASNDVDTYSGLTKATACFDDNTEIDVVILYPGLILAVKIADSVGAAGYKPFTQLQSAGSGRLDVGATAYAGVGILLSQIVNVAAVSYAALLVQRGII